MTKPTRDQLFDEAINWLDSKINSEQRSSSTRDQGRLDRKTPQGNYREEKNPRSSWFCLPEALLNNSSNPSADTINQLARKEGREKLNSSVTVPDNEAPVETIAVKICHQWGHADSALLARAWLTKSNDMESRKYMEHPNLALIIGVAAAAAVLALVIVVRRCVSVTITPHTLEPSGEFKCLASVAKAEGEAAEIAGRIQSKVSEPWSWRLTNSLGRLSHADKRCLLSALADQEQLDCGVSAFVPKAGENFEPSRMSTAVATNADDIWVVASDTPNNKRGYSVAGHVEVQAEVEACTADWWIISRAECPVGEKIKEMADTLVAGGSAKAASWRAPWGFTYPEDLRALPETDLESWRQRLISELNPRYNDRPERQLLLVGNPGEPFESSMETEDGRSPVGDAVVSEVVLRDGVPQLGLACLGGSPLLLAVVRTKPARSDT